MYRPMTSRSAVRLESVVPEILPFEYRGFGLRGPMFCVCIAFKCLGYARAALDPDFYAP